MRTKIITDDISLAADIIRGGGLVAVPTETVYGLAGNGLDEGAVQDIYNIKGRPEVKPLSLMVPGLEALDAYGVDVPAAAYALAEKFWPGPLTIIVKAKKHIPSIVLAGGDTVGLRCPDHPLTLALLKEVQLPLAAPSANPSGAPSPKRAEQVAEYFNGSIRAIIDGGECGLGMESTIIDMSAAPYRILRQGALAEEDILAALEASLTVVGITGGTGCGKTTALNVLRDMGALIIDCDELYHELTVSSEPMRNELCQRFGEVYNGTVLDRKKLGGIVFNDPEALKDLNAITHKYVDWALQELLRQHALNGGRLAAIDAIGLLDISFARKTAFNVAVTAPVEERVKRLIAREGISEDYARMRIAAQKSNEYFAENCDHVLVNDSDLAAFQDTCETFFKEELKDVR